METPHDLQESFWETNKEMTLWEVQCLRDESGVFLTGLHLGRKDSDSHQHIFNRPLFLCSHHQAH